ncbi:MAG TPA: hypothetical protein IGR64_02810 [Leptolyngbyaceae cyanobacterium M65_K2018_010]|nr:hypothetical protein [Leptolyngbyaceae cyanobacterium M65_K2018_010]
MPSPLTAPHLSWYLVPPDLKDLLWAAAVSWQDEAQADRYIQQAIDHPATSLDVLVSAYRYFFYRHNDRMAQQIAQQVLALVAEAEDLPQTWPALQPILRQRRTDPPIRLYLTAYSALGMMLARLGEVDEAQAIAGRLQSVDDDNEFGAKLILDILSPQEDDDD